MVKDGLLIDPVMKEVVLIAAEDDTVYNAECYTVPKSAEALGRTPVTFKRWISEELIPSPILKEVKSGYMQYEAGELDTIREQLAIHEREFDYFHHTHLFTIERIREAVEEYRKENF